MDTSDILNGNGIDGMTPDISKALSVVMANYKPGKGDNDMDPTEQKVFDATGINLDPEIGKAVAQATGSPYQMPLPSIAPAQNYKMALPTVSPIQGSNTLPQAPTAMQIPLAQGQLITAMQPTGLPQSNNASIQQLMNLVQGAA